MRLRLPHRWGHQTRWEALLEWAIGWIPGFWIEPVLWWLWGRELMRHDWVWDDQYQEWTVAWDD